jgi:hypothetical protein
MDSPEYNLNLKSRGRTLGFANISLYGSGDTRDVRQASDLEM